MGDVLGLLVSTSENARPSADRVRRYGPRRDETDLSKISDWERPSLLGIGARDAQLARTPGRFAGTGAAAAAGRAVPFATFTALPLLLVASSSSSSPAELAAAD